MLKKAAKSSILVVGPLRGARKKNQYSEKKKLEGGGGFRALVVGQLKKELFYSKYS